MTPEYLNEMAQKIHQQNVDVGWWDNDPDVRVKALLIITELAEAIEAWRRDSMDDHLPHRHGEEVELADALIRTLDLLGRLHYDVDNIFNYSDFDYQPLHFYNTAIYGACVFISRIPIEEQQLKLVASIIISIAEHKGYDLKAAMEEKIEYNRKRADHKRENRAKEGGKKF